ncbi:fatty-acyl-CoA synthase [Roseimicrobium gellanilyticum]|uniref:Fatty-acyl-CoA synthase n=1 Tax=Roseimicrobium gellanilyticum TaxID=748857 RepID=A0A366HV88_9BACT|nr:AMP-binding protein [Roseimicrobium gellanilyticum]RBP48186.1 fatty-acyl-CoA synthase [Roseimicrobium gellanilyticum]
MIYVDDQAYDRGYFEKRFAQFDAHPVLSRCTGRRLAVCLQDTALWIALCLYVKEEGGTVFPLPIDTPLEGARRRAERSGCEVLIVASDDGELGVEEANSIKARPDIPDGLIQTSSGTTGEPKFIERTWASIDTEIESYVSHFPDANAWTPIVACPVTHSYGLICGVLVALRRGQQPVIVRNFNPKYILRKLRETPTSILYSSPAMIATLAMLVKQEEPLWAVMTSGTVLQKATFESLGKKVRHLYQQYGCSEAGCLSLGTGLLAAIDQGKPLPHVTITAGANTAEPADIIVTLPDGRKVETRDLGYFENGRLYFVSRLDEMINVAGFNVYPGEVEEVILAMPGIRDAVVFKKSRGFGGDQVCLHFVSDEEISADAVRDFCAGRLAAHQIPMNIARVEAIPRLPNGKISRKALAEAPSAPALTF